MDTKDAGALGGNARARNMTKDERSEAARHAANVRHERDRAKKEAEKEKE